MEYSSKTKRSTDLMLILGFNETIYHFTMASSVGWYGHVLRRDDGHVFRRALEFEVEGQGRKGSYGGHVRSRLRKKV